MNHAQQINLNRIDNIFCFLNFYSLIEIFKKFLYFNYRNEILFY